MSILQNAIDSIQIGVEDFANEDYRRNVSALRNIAAGTLLLFKEQLCRMSPLHDKELLIKKDITPAVGVNGVLTFKGKGKKTVDVFQIKERFESLNVKVDWKRLEEITNLRNDLEHYYASKSPDAVREVVAKSFLLIRDFVVNELEESPQQLFGDACWGALLKTSEVYSVEDAACQASISKIDWKYLSVNDALEHLRCPHCLSSLVEASDEDDVYPDVSLHCKSCNHEFRFADVVEKCIENLYGGQAYIAAKEGEEPPYGNCLECGKEAFILHENRCIACEAEMEYTCCSSCEQTLTLDEQINEGMCSYCNYQYEKLMRE